jgi:hypothetical protein
MRRSRTAPLLAGIAPGLAIVVIGVLLILENFEIIEFGGIWKIWPLLLIGFGFGAAFEPGGRNRVFGLVVAAVGIGLQLRNFGLLDINFETVRIYWPALLIAIGIANLVRFREPGSVNSGVIMLSMGVFFQLWTLGKFRLDQIWQFWPIALVAIGIGMVIKVIQDRKRIPPPLP